MYQQDYILRMIEMIGKFIASVLGLIKGGKYEEAEEMLGNVYYEVLKEDAAFFRSIPAEKLTQTLLQEHNYTNGHLEILAGLFTAEAELQYVKGRKEGALSFSQKALLLFEFVDGEQKTYMQERIDKINSLKARIEELSDFLGFSNNQ